MRIRRKKLPVSAVFMIRLMIGGYLKRHILKNDGKQNLGVKGLIATQSQNIEVLQAVNDYSTPIMSLE